MRALKPGTAKTTNVVQIATTVLPKAPTPISFEGSHNTSLRTLQVPESSINPPNLSSLAQNGIVPIAGEAVPHTPLQQTTPTFPPIDALRGKISPHLGFSGIPTMVSPDNPPVRPKTNGIAQKTLDPQLLDPMLLQAPAIPESLVNAAPIVQQKAKEGLSDSVMDDMFESLDTSKAPNRAKTRGSPVPTVFIRSHRAIKATNSHGLPFKREAVCM